MKKISCPPYATPALTIAGLIFAGAQASAVTIDFDTAADFEDNFWAPTNRSLVEWQSGGFIDKEMPNSNPTTLVYNTNATGGSEGLAGTTANPPLDKFDNYVISADVSMAAFAPGNSFGLYTKLNDAADSGDIIFLRFNNGSSFADFRVFTGVDATSSNGVGSGSEANAQNIAGTTSFSTNTYYTFRVEVEDLGDDVRYTGSLWTTDASPSQIGNTVSYTVVDGSTGLGQVGMRLSTANGTGAMEIDNFTITNIPEAGHWAAILSGLVGLGLVVRRRKQS